MKNNYLRIAIFSVGLATLSYCTPKQTVKNSEVRVSAAALAEGAAIMTASCGKCHSLHNANQFTQTQWDKILKRMIPKAKLSEQEGQLLSDYIMYHAKDSNN